MEKPKILVVDDNESISKFYSTLTKDSNYETETVSNTEDALKEIATTPPDLIIADLFELPNWAEISKLAKSYNISLVCASSFQKAKDINLPDFVRIFNKPFKDIDLGIIIRSEIAKRSGG